MNKIINNFNISGKILSCEKYGEGHINDTYLLCMDNNNKIEKYILQKVNNNIFKDIPGLMNNIYLVTSFLKEQIIKANGNPDRETLNLVKTKDGQIYYFDLEEQKHYRLYLFVEDSLTLQNASTKELFKESAYGFGKFQNLLASFDASQLIEVIPNFHNTKERLNHFLKVLKEDKLGRAKECQKEIDFILKRKDDCSIVVDLINEGKIPLKVTHNDTKLNNVLLDNTTKKALCVIDLDTVMPGSSLYDFGDSIRFGCNSAAEDEKDLSKVNFLLDYFKAYAEGFLSEVKESLNEYELKYLAFGAKIMTLECGIRFLDDYLDGDNYFKTHREKHNLDRCRTQLKLVAEMEKHLDEMNQIVFDLAK